MTKEAQNCLLKTLEEPPKFVTIILISSNENLILNTIKSRCMKIKFKNIHDDILCEYAKNSLGYEEVNNNLLKTFGGSIGKAVLLKKNSGKYIDIDNLISRLEVDDIISIFNTSKDVFDKENIFEILEYMNVILYSKSTKDKRYLNCIEYVNETIKKIKANGNFDMNIDFLLLKMWEELNEKNNRS